MDNNSLFVQTSSKKHDYPTPRKLYNELDDEFGFTLDPCASDSNHKCDQFYTYHDNGLIQDWSGEIVYMNPPYGDVSKWMAKAYRSCVEGGATVVCLVPSRTSTKWWHRYAMKGEVRYIKGRITFEGAKHNAPFCSSIIIFRPGNVD